MWSLVVKLAHPRINHHRSYTELYGIIRNYSHAIKRGYLTDSHCGDPRLTLTAVAWSCDVNRGQKFIYFWPQQHCPLARRVRPLTPRFTCTVPSPSQMELYNPAIRVKPSAHLPSFSASEIERCWHELLGMWHIKLWRRGYHESNSYCRVMVASGCRHSLVGRGPTTAFGRDKPIPRFVLNYYVILLWISLCYCRWILSVWLRNEGRMGETAAYHYLTSAAKWVINEPIGLHSPVQQHKSWYRLVTLLPDQTRK